MTRLTSLTLLLSIPATAFAHPAPAPHAHDGPDWAQVAFLAVLFASIAAASLSRVRGRT